MRTRSTQIVVIAMSAGGPEALREMFLNSKQGTGLSFLVLSHATKSTLVGIAETLRHVTTMAVIIPIARIQLQADTIYLVPTQSNLNFVPKTLIVGPDGQSKTETIDTVVSRAIDGLATPVIGVFLSGLGYDGATACLNIVKNDGLVAVQEPTTAKNREMPTAALNTGFAAAVLPPGKMLPFLLHAAELMQNQSMQLRESVEHVRPMLLRDVQCPINLWGDKAIAQALLEKAASLHLGIAQTLAHLDENVIELHSIHSRLSHLPHDGFFSRDSLHPDTLRSVLSVLLDRWRDHSIFKKGIRIWVPQCGNGEVAYAVAMVIQGELDRRRSHIFCQIIATDTSTERLRQAEVGHYGAHVLNSCPLSLAIASFIRKPNAVTIAPRIRERVVFSRAHPLDLAGHQEFDIVFAAHWLSLLDPQTKAKVIEILQQSCNSDGISIND